jgi:hypothetical protein
MGDDATKKRDKHGDPPIGRNTRRLRTEAVLSTVYVRLGADNPDRGQPNAEDDERKCCGCNRDATWKKHIRGQWAADRTLIFTRLDQLACRAG